MELYDFGSVVSSAIATTGRWLASVVLTIVIALMVGGIIGAQSVGGWLDGLRVPLFLPLLIFDPISIASLFLALAAIYLPVFYDSIRLKLVGLLIIAGSIGFIAHRVVSAFH